MTKFSPLAIVGISVASLVGAYLFLKGGKTVIKNKLGVEPKTLLGTLTNRVTNSGRFVTNKKIQGSSSLSDAVSELVSETEAVFGSRSSSKGGGSRRKCKKGGKRKTKCKK